MCYALGMENSTSRFNINWFPGHMAQTLKMIDVELKNCDAIIYVVDARCPQSCINPQFDDFVGRKPVLFVLNKIDLAPAGIKEKFIKSLQLKTPHDVITRNSVKSGGTQAVVNALQKLLADRIKAKLAHGITKTLRVAVIGVTNCGKSTFINNMTNKGKTQTGNRPGVTRTKQWVSITDNLWLLDTPGTLWPSFTNQQVARNLAYVGSIKDDILDTVALSQSLLADLNKLQPEAVLSRFGVTTFEEIAKKRGCLLRGGVLDIRRAAKLILTEYREGKIGKFNLDELL
ncbi:MAG: ribosome biogenesis GTPase YlqF [Clostridia bacterium]|nr:ribosome biogenesis GTPase YlqF [Clostridia bacterium]